jgi:ribosomal protein L12E/L44/L45/RPP1/RPP2
LSEKENRTRKCERAAVAAAATTEKETVSEHDRDSCVYGERKEKKKEKKKQEDETMDLFRSVIQLLTDMGPCRV